MRAAIFMLTAAVAVLGTARIAAADEPGPAAGAVAGSQRDFLLGRALLPVDRLTHSGKAAVGTLLGSTVLGVGVGVAVAASCKSDPADAGDSTDGAGCAAAALLLPLVFGFYGFLLGAVGGVVVGALDDTAEWTLPSSGAIVDVDAQAGLVRVGPPASTLALDARGGTYFYTPLVTARF